MTIDKVLDKEDGWYKRLGKIESISVGIEDHGLLNLSIGLNFEGSIHQGFTCILDDAAKDPKDEFIGRIGTVFGCEIIRRLCHAFEVENICDIKGKIAYALYDNGDFMGGFIQGIEIPSFNQRYTKIRKIVTKEIFKEIEDIQKMEKGEIPFKEFEWS